jgi:hypothetical protein
MKDPFDMTPEELQAACNAHPDYPNYKKEVEDLRKKVDPAILEKLNIYLKESGYVIK